MRPSELAKRLQGCINVLAEGGVELRPGAPSEESLAEYQRQMILNDEGDELVTEDSGCPCCGELRMDWLEWTEDGENVICTTCGNVYDPTHKEV